MKIALVRVSSYQNWHKVPSFALGYLASVLEHNAISVQIFDGRFFNINDRKLYSEIDAFSPDIVAFTAMTHEIKRAYAIAVQLKEKSNPLVVFGGCHLTALPLKTMEEFPLIDYGVIGEGEYTFLELVKRIIQKEDCENIEGLVFRKNGTVCQTKPRLSITNLDDIPFPAFSHYYQEGKDTLQRQKLCYPILTSRGCPFKCVFCMRVLGENIRNRSVSNIVAEIELAINKYGADSIDFSDEIFLFNNNRTKELLNKFIETGIAKKIKWTGLTRVDMVDKEIIALAKKAGCVKLELGVESGNQEILKRINKNITLSQIESAIAIIKAEKIITSTYFILGHPGETIQTMNQTIDLAVTLNTDTIAVGIMVPYPGTKIFEWAKEQKFGYHLRSTDWSDYDKYGGAALEIDGLPIKKLELFQRKMLFDFYVKNFRIFDLFHFILSRYKGVFFLIVKPFIKNK